MEDVDRVEGVNVPLSLSLAAPAANKAPPKLGRHAATVNLHQTCTDPAHSHDYFFPTTAEPVGISSIIENRAKTRADDMSDHDDRRHMPDRGRRRDLEPDYDDRREDSYRRQGKHT